MLGRIQFKISPEKIAMAFLIRLKMNGFFNPTENGDFNSANIGFFSPTVFGYFNPTLTVNHIYFFEAPFEGLFAAPSFTVSNRLLLFQTFTSFS